MSDKFTKEDLKAEVKKVVEAIKDKFDGKEEAVAAAECCASEKKTTLESPDDTVSAIGHVPVPGSGAGTTVVKK